MDLYFFKPLQASAKPSNQKGNLHPNGFCGYSLSLTYCHYFFCGPQPAHPLPLCSSPVFQKLPLCQELSAFPGYLLSLSQAFTPSRRLFFLAALAFSSCSHQGRPQARASWAITGSSWASWWASRAIPRILRLIFPLLFFCVFFSFSFSFFYQPRQAPPSHPPCPHLLQVLFWAHAAELHMQQSCILLHCQLTPFPFLQMLLQQAATFFKTRKLIGLGSLLQAPWWFTRNFQHFPSFTQSCLHLQ